MNLRKTQAKSQNNPKIKNEKIKNKWSVHIFFHLLFL